MKKFYFWNDISGLEFGAHEGKTPLAAYESLLVDAGYFKDSNEFKRFTDDFLENNDIKFREVEDNYFISIDKAEPGDSIQIFGGFEYAELEHAKEAVADLKSDPENEHSFRIYKGYITTFDDNDDPLKARVLEII